MYWRQEGDILYRAPELVVHEPGDINESAALATFTIPGGTLSSKAVITIQTIAAIDGADTGGDINHRMSVGGIAIFADTLSGSATANTTTVQNRIQYVMWANSTTNIIANDASDVSGWGLSAGGYHGTIDSASDIVISTTMQSSISTNTGYLALFEVRLLHP